MDDRKDNIIMTDLIECAKNKFGSQAKCAEAMNWSRQKLNKILLRKREARVSEINALSQILDVPVSDVAYFLIDKSPNEQQSDQRSRNEKR